MKKVALRAHSGLFYDETAELCQWHVPSTHYLEMWSDARSVDGTVSIVQPLIQPMYAGKSPHEVVATLSDRAERTGYDVVREYWAATRPAPMPAPSPASVPAAPAAKPMAAPNGVATPALAAPPAPVPVPPTAASLFEKQWRKWLHDGYIPGTEFAPRAVALRADWSTNLPAATAASGFEVVFKRDSSDLRRPLLEQRLAAGTAQARHEAHLGQRGARGARAPRNSSA